MFCQKVEQTGNVTLLCMSFFLPCFPQRMFEPCAVGSKVRVRHKVAFLSKSSCVPFWVCDCKVGTQRWHTVCCQNTRLFWVSSIQFQFQGVLHLEGRCTTVLYGTASPHLPQRLTFRWQPANGPCSKPPPFRCPGPVVHGIWQLQSQRFFGWRGTCPEITQIQHAPCLDPA